MIGRVEKVKRLITGALLLFLCCSLSGCGSKEKISISLWAAEEKMDLMKDYMKDFQKVHEDEVEITYRISKEEEDTCRETILANPEGAPDLFAFADDQLDELKDNGILLELDVDPKTALARFGGEGSVAYESVVRGDKMYAYPETANGYFMYYNKKYFRENDVKTLDRMVEIAGNTQKKITMDLGSGWYLYSFFKGAGLELKLDETGEKNICNWNTKDTKPTGLDVAEAITAVTGKRGFEARGDDGFIEGVEDGTVIAGINGAWNAEKVKAAWGDDYAAVQLPTYTVDGKQAQMASFTGYKVLGIKAGTKHPKWCQMFAEFITSNDNQITEYEKTGEIPASIEVAGMDQLKDDPVVRALSDQSKFATLQRVAGAYWDATAKFGAAIASGNPDKRDLQQLLDDMVEGIQG
ncbi:MAG: extracellular solute-binding protein [Eubacterium sp.]|nr:extracellular solute-binding protein [Eubacterium sp.]